MFIKQDKLTPVLRIHPQDNVAVALKNLPAGFVIEIDGDNVLLKNNLPAKHKFFLNDISKGENMYMYGTIVGKANADLLRGDVMTTANTTHATFDYQYKGYLNKWTPPDVTRFLNRTFNGYRRKDGRYGTANYWLFIPMVFCENRNLEMIKSALNKELGYSKNEKYNYFTNQLKNAFNSGQDILGVGQAYHPAANTTRFFKNIDGIKFLTHNGGCGGTRQDADTLGSLLAAYADHPNVAGVTVLSLGCQHLQTPIFLEKLKQRNFSKPLICFEQQEAESEESLIYSAIRETFAGLVEANRLEREPAPLSELTIGVKCGGSDGFSGISANPAVGHASDLLVALGGKVLLAEFPELAGAEQDLIDRCVQAEHAEKFITLMKTYDELAHRLGSGFHMNPSPGNIRDGLITDSMKSCGAARKGGTSPVVDVLDYTEQAVTPGLNLLCTPGNDVEATTGQAASGATVILFTTGLGTPTGNPVAPTVKISSNTAVATRMSDIIDINTGGVITGDKTIEEMGEEILQYTIRVASGEETPKAVLLQQDDFIPWKRGVSL